MLEQRIGRLGAPTPTPCSGLSMYNFTVGPPVSEVPRLGIQPTADRAAL